MFCIFETKVKRVKTALQLVGQVSLFSVSQKMLSISHWFFDWSGNKPVSERQFIRSVKNSSLNVTSVYRKYIQIYQILVLQTFFRSFMFKLIFTWFWWKMIGCSIEPESYSEFLCISLDSRYPYNNFLSPFGMHSCLSARVPGRNSSFSRWLVGLHSRVKSSNHITSYVVIYWMDAPLDDRESTKTS